MKTTYTLRHISLVIAFFLSISCLSSQAQNFQAIPSYSFGSALYYAQGLNNAMYLDTPSQTWYLDVSSTDVYSTTYINVAFENVDDITGIAYFPNLVKLDASYNNLTSVPDLSSLTFLDTLNVSYNYLSYFSNQMPQDLRYLDCSHNEITPTLAPYIGVGPSFSSLTYLDCSYNYVGNLNQQLSNYLKYLDCNNNIIQYLPPLPYTLEYLNCAQNSQNTAYPLSSLPALPSRLRYLDCSQNNIDSLPSFSDSLRYIDVHDNFFIDTIPVLPAVLEYLNCSGDRILSLPPLNAALKQLICHTQTIWDTSALGHHGLVSLPALPSGLMVLDCSENSLDSLPSLPISLDTLWCGDNHINTLPSLPVHLIELSCYSNNLYSLPTLPGSLKLLGCSNNHLSVLPPLSPSLTELDAASNNLTSLSYLPQGIQYLALNQNPNLSCLPRIYQNRLNYFYISGTNIQCMPNRVSGYAGRYDIRPDSLPLCGAASGCEFYYNAAGNVHMDTAASCAMDSIYPGTAVSNMKVQLRQGGNVIEQFYTFGSGGYSFKTPSLSSYTITLDTALLPISILCPQARSRSITLTALDSVKKYESFGMQCTGTDYGIVSMVAGRFRPGLTASMTITSGNMARLLYHTSCGSGTGGTVTTTWDNAVAYAGPAPGALTPSSVIGQTLTYNVANLDALTPGSLSILVAVDSHAVANTYSCFTTTITPSATDVNMANNSLTACVRLVNSWDPNYKEVSTDTIRDNAGDWLTYTIHFQNTGNDTAYLVVLKDTLSQYLNAASFQYLASSHPAVVQLEGGAMTFTFPHINLVDSATNPPLSEGWIQYRVRANAGLPNGTAINNTAYIYFDLNPAVVTNTATTAVQLATCVDGDIYDSTTICQGDTFVYGGMTMTTTGFYYNLMQNATGCDTTYHIWLTVLPAVHTTLYDTICPGASVSFGGHQLTAAGTYSDTLASAGGCDSIISLTLTVRPVNYLLIADTICSGEKYIYLHDTLTTSDSAIYIFHNAYGCDSFVQLILTVRPSLQTMLYDTICAGSSYAFAGHQLTAAGTYSDTLASAGGCDSIISLTLTVRPVNYLLIADTICSGEKYIYLHDTLTTSDSAIYIFHNAYGCDSFVQLILTVRPIPVVHFTFDSLLRDNGLDSTGHSAVICFDPSMIFTMKGGTPEGGHYSGVGIINDTMYINLIRHNDTIVYTYTDGTGCTGRDTCYLDYRICEGINDIPAKNSIHLYPDPNTGIFTLQTERSYGLSYRVYDVLGKEVIQSTITADTQPIRLPDVAEGVYTISVDGARPLRFVVVR